MPSASAQPHSLAPRHHKSCRRQAGRSSVWGCGGDVVDRRTSTTASFVNQRRPPHASSIYGARQKMQAALLPASPARCLPAGRRGRAAPQQRGRNAVVAQAAPGGKFKVSAPLPPRPRRPPPNCQLDCAGAGLSAALPTRRDPLRPPAGPGAAASGPRAILVAIARHARAASLETRRPFSPEIPPPALTTPPIALPPPGRQVTLIDPKNPGAPITFEASGRQSILDQVRRQKEGGYRIAPGRPSDRDLREDK